MSGRVLRDEIWTSERANSLRDRTFRLYMCLLSAADDFGLVRLEFGEIRRAAPLQSWPQEEVEKMLAELCDCGLIVPYQADGKRYGALFAWQAFIRSSKPKYPMPPFGLGHVRRPPGFKDRTVRAAAAALLPHLNLEDPEGRVSRGTQRVSLADPQGTPGAALGREGLWVKGKGKTPPPTPSASGETENGGAGDSGGSPEELRQALLAYARDKRHGITNPEAWSVWATKNRKELHADVLANYRTARARAVANAVPPPPPVLRVTPPDIAKTRMREIMRQTGIGRQSAETAQAPKAAIDGASPSS